MLYYNLHMNLFKSYYHLAKPGIIYGNLLSVVAGFFLASKNHPNFGLLIALILGVSFIIGSGCVFNNCIDRDIDKKMMRTQKRSIPTGEIRVRNAIIYASILGFLGFFLLLRYTNVLTAVLGFIGYFFYIVVYGYAKRHTVYSTIIGSISGAMPIVAGYTAVTNRIDTGAILLFLILAFWQ